MQIIKYKWLMNNGGFGPVFFAFEGGSIKRIPLISNALSINVGKRKCIGYFSNGRYFPCPHDRILETHICNECRLNDGFFMCMRCDGSECINRKQRSTCMENVYFIYIAAFDSLLKVGISHERRLIERLVEQGADFAAKIGVVKDGKDVRSVEQAIKKYLSVADRITGEEKQRRLFCSPNSCVEAIADIVSNLRNNGNSEINSFIERYFVPPEIYDLRSYYGLENVEYMPKHLPIADNSLIEGTPVAAKGNIIVFRNRTLFSVNAHELIGRDVEISQA